MSAPFNVFVCSTFDDLVDERQGVLEAIRRVQQRHSAMEYFGARDARPIETCLEEVRASNVLIVVVGQKYGSLAPGLGISYSQAEYEEGFRLQKPCLAYIRDENVPILPKHAESDPGKLRLLRGWKQTLQSRHTVAGFEDRKRLADQVAIDLGRVLAEKRFGPAVAETSQAKGVPEAPLREVLKKLGETEVAEAEIPDRLAKAANELLRLRDDLTRLRNDRPEFAAIRARASAAIDRGELDAARAALNEGRERARASREEASQTEAQFLADEARVDRLQLNYNAACAKLTEAARLDPDNVWLWINLGDLWKLRGSLAEAERAFLAARDAAARSGSDAALCDSHIWVGDGQVARGDLVGALKSYRDSLRIADRLAQSDPGNTEWQCDLSLSYDRIGEVQAAQGDLAAALKSYRDSLAISDRVAKCDPSNTQRQNALSVSHNKVGDVQVIQGDLAGALKSYRADLAITAHLAQFDPGNAGWQRDLSVSYNKIGNVQLARGDIAGALTSYRDSLAIRDRLAKADPSNAGWRRDLSVSYARVGDVQVAQGDLAGALTSYRDSLAISDRLAQSDPGNAGWRSDLAVSNAKIADALRKLGNDAEALAALRRGHAIMVRLTALSPENAQWKQKLDFFEVRIAEISQ
jgi:tetratricopeptide (TPR) repeat protein